MNQILVNYINNLAEIGISLEYSDVEAAYMSVDDEIINKASVLLLPLAAANGVVYGMDRLGGLVPFQFSRITEATLFDKDMNMQAVDSGMPRIDYGNYSSDAKILIEKASTNLVPASEILNSSNQQNIDGWTNITVIAQASRTKLSSYVEKGMQTIAFEILDTLTNYHSIFNKGVGRYLNFNTQYTVSFAGQRSENLSWPMFIRLQNGTGNLISLGNVSLSPEWSDFSVTAISSSDTSIDKDVTGFYNSFTLNAGNWIKFRKLQVEQGSQKTSYIPTAGSAITRSADLLTYDLARACPVYLKTTKQEVILDKRAGTWNIHEDLNNDGIRVLAIMPVKKISTATVSSADVDITGVRDINAISVSSEDVDTTSVRDINALSISSDETGQNFVTML